VRRAISERAVRLGLIIVFGPFAFSVAAVSPGGAAARGPKSVPVQISLAAAMVQNEDWQEAARRWIEILYYFGPSDQDARAEFELGAIALRRGRPDLAESQWEKTVAGHPDSEWAVRASQALGLLGNEPSAASITRAEPHITSDTPAHERQFLIAEGDFAHELYVFALRDYLKVTNFYPNSPRAAEARFRAGDCQIMLGRPDLAIEQWQRVTDEHPDSPQAGAATAAIAAWQGVLQISRRPPSEVDLEPAWMPFRLRDTTLDQGLSYAEDLYENDSFVYALQEYAKVLCDIYTPEGEENPHQAYARYRMGVCAYRLRRPEAAARQWRSVIEADPDSPWAGRATRALAAVGAIEGVSAEVGGIAPRLPEELPTPLLQRFHLAAQLLDCGLPEVALKEYLKVIFVLTAGNPNPFQAEAAYRVGICHHERGRPDLALEAWNRVIDEYPETEWAEQATVAVAQTRQCESVLSMGVTRPMQ
jgi:TolA-binding protein